MPEVDVPDAIQRELILPVPPERVGTALTQANQLAAWFGTHATIDLRPGGDIIFTWDGSNGPTGTNRGVIELVEPPRRFAFRWQSGADNLPTTRVEFTFEPHPEGTHLRLVESGFASLPPEQRGRARERNGQGWDHELGELHEHVVTA
jgi:uncharacterized protein YndB with AHSA1/START domain